MFVLVEVSVSSNALAWRVGMSQQTVWAVKRVVVSMFFRSKDRQLLNTHTSTIYFTMLNKVYFTEQIFVCMLIFEPLAPKLIIMSALPLYSFLNVKGVTSVQTFSAVRMARSTSDFFKSGV